MYYNRDLSWLEFNHRVLQEAACEKVPLFERIKFLSIFSSNLDEFFSIRYPVILAISNLKAKTQRKIENSLPEHFLEKIQVQIENQLAEFDNIFTNQIIPQLKANDIILYYNEPLKKEHVAEAREKFLSNVLSFLQPVFLVGDMLKKFEPEANKLYMVITVKKYGEKEVQHAIIKIPSDNLKRFYTLSPIDGKHYVVFIDDIIRENSSYIFPGFEIVGIYSLKFNRNADLDFEEDYHGDILAKIEKKLVKRAWGHPSRFLYESSMPRNVQLFVASIFGIEHDEIFTDGRYHNLSDLSSFPDFGKNLTYEEWKPLYLPSLSGATDIFNVIEEKDILLHFPYHSYNPVLSFFNQAAIDPDVREIYITLYRVASDSLIANALISAAKNGKKVTVFIELKARFDEANNIIWSKKMKKAGIRLIYSIPGIKVHTKIALVTRGIDNKKKMYSIISTGNFNELTARFYTDHALFTTDKEITTELLALFHFLEKREQKPRDNEISFKKLYVSQFNMADNFKKLVENEIKKVKNNGKGLIRLKINNLEEQGMIDLLYKASKAGVTIHLLIRSICCLVPGVKDLSENIQVKRLVDRYLEHTRIFIFGEDSEAQIIIGSADWMTRNLYHRIELCTPIADASCRQELLDYFSLQWQDTDKDALLDPGIEVSGYEQEIKRGQQSIYNYIKEGIC
ncbi:MAG: polyphosphate kinase 1 [Taibaiella sp.]|nr:polyphosphate kinase 1 [Taibaiella sp.]